MNLNKLKTVVGEMLENFRANKYPELKIKFFDEMTYDISENPNNEEDIQEDTILIYFNTLAGTIDNATAIVPAQLTILSEKNSIEKTKEFFNDFANEYSNKLYSESLDFVAIKPIFSSPVVVQPFIENDNGYRTMLYVGASFTVYSNISTLSSFKIDEEEIDVESFHIGYSASQTPSQLAGEKKLMMLNNNAALTIQVVTRPYVTIFNNKLKGIRTGQLDSNTTFQIKLEFTDGSTEEYKMININNDQGGGKNEVDLLTITFAETR